MRKRWTPKTEVTDSLLKFREKRKWQIALRRYVLEKNKGSFYAPYFGLDINTFRNWIEAQFDETLHWNNFSTAWQFDHVVPVTYFDFSEEEDLRLCWNFINITIQKVHKEEENRSNIDVIAAKAYFTSLYEKTSYSLCSKMIAKLNKIEQAQLQHTSKLEAFIITHKEVVEALATFGNHEFARLNEGTSLPELLAEQELLKRFG